MTATNICSNFGGFRSTYLTMVSIFWERSSGTLLQNFLEDYFCGKEEGEEPFGYRLHTWIPYLSYFTK